MKTGIPGPEGSLSKWQWADYNQALTELGNEVLGPEGMRVDTDWSYRFLRSRANSIERHNRGAQEHHRRARARPTTPEVTMNVTPSTRGRWWWVLGLPRLR